MAELVEVFQEDFSSFTSETFLGISVIFHMGVPKLFPWSELFPCIQTCPHCRSSGRSIHQVICFMASRHEPWSSVQTLSLRKQKALISRIYILTKKELAMHNFLNWAGCIHRPIRISQVWETELKRRFQTTHACRQQYWRRWGGNRYRKWRKTKWIRWLARRTV